MTTGIIPRTVPATKMTAEEKALYQRIAADPASATQAERHQIFGRPPPDEEDRLCKEKTGLTMKELQHKVMTDLESLTELETRIVTSGATYNLDGYSDIGHHALWYFNLVDDEHQLASQVYNLLVDDYEAEVGRRAHLHTRVFEDDRLARLAQRRQERAEAQAAKLRASRPQWVNHMYDAKVRQWGFVIFRTAYSEGTEQNWQHFQVVYINTRRRVFHETWRRSNNLFSMHQEILVSDPSLEGADLDVLRQRFKAMRERNEIPGCIATDCFLVADQAVLDHPVVLSKTQYQPRGPGEPDPWHNTFSLRVVNPDYDASAPIPPEEDLSGYEGVITIPLPKVFDWLYYCFFSKSEDWETRYKVVKGGEAEQMVSAIFHLYLGLLSISGTTI